MVQTLSSDQILSGQSRDRPGVTAIMVGAIVGSW